MNREFLTELGIAEETARQIIVEHGKSTEKIRNMAEAAKTELEDLQKRLADRDMDIEALQAAAGRGSELERQLNDLQARYRADTEALNRQITETRLNAALDAAIAAEKGRNTKAIKALLDVGKLRLGEDGTLEALDLAPIRESDPYLFDTETSEIEGTGAGGAGEDGGRSSDPSRMSMAEYKAWRERRE